jgi:hypothetical protein
MVKIVEIVENSEVWVRPRRLAYVYCFTRIRIRYRSLLFLLVNSKIIRIAFLLDENVLG